MKRFLTFVFVLAAAVVLSGCVRRTIAITSTPPNALVWLNGREIGRTPVEVDFLYYGVYDVQLVADGFEPLITSSEAKPPWWDSIPFDLFAEVTPGQKHARVDWHFEMHERNDDPAALVERARELRGQLAPDSETAQPASASETAEQPGN